MRSMVKGVPLALCVGLPPSVAFGDTVPRKREEGPDCNHLTCAKNVRSSSTKSLGTSDAAKWPPSGISRQ